MSENNWKTPSAVIGIITTLIAIGGLYYKHREIEQLKVDQANKDHIEQIRQNREDDCL